VCHHVSTGFYYSSVPLDTFFYVERVKVCNMVAFNVEEFVSKPQNSDCSFLFSKLLLISVGPLLRMQTEVRRKVNVYLPSLMMKVPDHLYVLG
jgi:hypothetical protein